MYNVYEDWFRDWDRTSPPPPPFPDVQHDRCHMNVVSPQKRAHLLYRCIVVVFPVSVLGIAMVCRGEAARTPSNSPEHDDVHEIHVLPTPFTFTQLMDAFFSCPEVFSHYMSCRYGDLFSNCKFPVCLSTPAACIGDAVICAGACPMVWLHALYGECLAAPAANKDSMLHPVPA